MTSLDDDRMGGAKKVILLAVAGSENLAIFNSFQLSFANSGDSGRVLAQLEIYCVLRTKETYKKFHFLTRKYVRK